MTPGDDHQPIFKVRWFEEIHLQMQSTSFWSFCMSEGELRDLKVAQSSLGEGYQKRKGTVTTRVCPSFRFGVSFRPILLCLILNWLLGAH